METGSYRGGTGEPLILLHGFTDTWHAWDPVLPALTAQCEVFAWTLPGHHGGEAWDPSVPVSIDAIANLGWREDSISLDLIRCTWRATHLADGCP